MNLKYYIRRPSSILVILAGAIALTGCQTAPMGSSTPPAPELQLLEARPLTVAEGCEANGSYFIEFTVLSDGRTGNIEPPAGPACVQEALTAWVSTFRYAPPGQRMPASVEWMMVTGRRGS